MQVGGNKGGGGRSPVEGHGGSRVGGDVCHGKIFEVFSRAIATTKLSGKLVRRLDGLYVDLDQVSMITYHDDYSSALQTVDVG
jgi:hypothetical protein